MQESSEKTKTNSTLEEQEFYKGLSEKGIESQETHRALLNILEDVEESRSQAVEEKNKTLAIITNFTDGLLFFNENNNLVLINPVAEDLLDVRAIEVISSSLLKKTSFPRFEKAINILRESGDKKIFRKEVEIGENLIIEVSAVKIERGDKKIGTLLALHDVTREKLVERLKTEFVSLSAHQLRTPLSAIKWTLKMILDGDMGKINEEQRDLLTKTYESNERMISLINDLLNVTRIEEGRYVYKKEAVDLKEIVGNIVKNYKEEAKRRGINFNFNDPKEKLPKAKVDVEKIKLAITNLIDNAIRYTPEGGKVIASLEKKNKSLEFSVKDSGIGVPEDQQQRLFTKFFRASSAVRIETEGSGLGLFICKNIIEAHNGEVWFESEEGKGSKFYFSIPV
jgi:signal transduction histidine kinase